MIVVDLPVTYINKTQAVFSQCGCCEAIATHFAVGSQGAVMLLCPHHAALIECKKNGEAASVSVYGSD
ncbi:MAG TPA: hypothetical protein V6C65_04470 [Allocoleopsis sp.]